MRRGRICRWRRCGSGSRIEREIVNDLLLLLRLTLLLLQLLGRIWALLLVDYPMLPVMMCLNQVPARVRRPEIGTCLHAQATLWQEAQRAANSVQMFLEACCTLRLPPDMKDFDIFKEVDQDMRLLLPAMQPPARRSLVGARPELRASTICRQPD
jgi:hypothetical protein